MKRIIFCFFTLLVCIRCSNSSISGRNNESLEATSNLEMQTETPDELSKLLFNCLKNKNYDCFASFILSKEDGVDLHKTSTFSEEEKKKNTEEFEENYKILLNKAKSEYDLLIEQAEKDGIVWEQTRYSKSSSKIQDFYGVQSTRIILYFTYKGNSYDVSFDEVLKSKNGWRLLGGFNYNNHRHEKAFQGSPDAIADSISNFLEKQR